ncbi:MAG: SDR family oxidoreductase [Bacteroidia bacterium]|jgi:3-oxoacyl-[acyl-carrier protein] reductase|nr:SDR family oxidoreductase [Bacteroidia bacterium]
MKQYLVAGASGGIGAELVKLLSKHAHVIALTRNPEALSGMNQVTALHADITNVQQQLPNIEGELNGLVYCPGTINLKPFRALKQEDFLNDWQVNVGGAIHVIKHYLPHLQQANHSSIVLFSTVAVQTGMAFHASIAAAKGAIEGLTKSLAAEFAPKIRVNAVAPSLTKTPLADKLINAEAKLKAAEERHPLKRIGDAVEPASAAHFLLTSDWITGQILTVDGGLSSLR